jgi:hypothetical protein
VGEYGDLLNRSPWSNRPKKCNSATTIGREYTYLFVINIEYLLQRLGREVSVTTARIRVHQRDFIHGTIFEALALDWRQHEDD